MTEHSVRPAPRAVRMVLGALLVAGLTWVMAGEVRARLPWPERQVAVPAASAGPEEVVRAYVDALDARDVDTAQALSTREHADSTERWHRNTESIKKLEILPPRRERRANYAEAVFVPVYFDLEQHRAESMENGRTRWGYVLVRRSAAERWLILDQGPV